MLRLPTPQSYSKPHLEVVALDDAVMHVGTDLPQHSDHGDVCLSSTRGRTHQQVLVAAQGTSSMSTYYRYLQRTDAE